MWIWPVKGAAAACVKPSFVDAKVQVWSARMVWAEGRPVSQSRPLGMSTASFLAGCAFIQSMAVSKGGRRSPRAPVPRRASMSQMAVEQWWERD